MSNPKKHDKPEKKQEGRFFNAKKLKQQTTDARATIRQRFSKWIPKDKEWKNISKVLTRKDKQAILLLIVIAIGALVAIGIQQLYISKRTPVPAFGGTYKEGIVGQPRLVNPVLAQTNEADLDLSEIIFSSLFKYTPDGTLENDLATEIDVQEEGKVYTITVRDNALWHDGTPLTIDDILFTIQIIQDPTYESPLRTNWQGVTAEKIDDQALKLTLKTPYTPFQHNLTFGILPKHIWEVIDAQNIKLAQQNTKPIGSGPYKFSKFQKDKNGNITEFELIANQEYYAKKPYIEKITFFYFNNEDELIEAFNKKKVEVISGISPQKLELIERKNHTVLEAHVPQYFAVFFNPLKNESLGDTSLRKAFALASNKEQILSDVAKDKGTILHSPIPVGIFSHTDDLEKAEYNTEEARKLLDENGWKDLNNDGIRSKVEENATEESDDAEKLEMTLTTTNWPDFIKTAEILKEDWESIGIKVHLEILEPADIQTTRIRPREYELLLFGEISGADPDPFSFWHSSQVKDPGLNLAVYENADVDQWLEEGRQITDQDKREQLYTQFQQQIAKDTPAIFLYQPAYLMVHSEKIFGFDIQTIALPSKRFADITMRYIKTKLEKPQEATQ